MGHIGWVGPPWGRTPLYLQSPSAPAGAHGHQAPGGCFLVPDDSQMWGGHAGGLPEKAGPRGRAGPHISWEPPIPRLLVFVQNMFPAGQAQPPSQRPSPGPKNIPMTGPHPCWPLGDSDPHPVQDSQRWGVLPCDLHPSAALHPRALGPHPPARAQPGEPLCPLSLAAQPLCSQSGASPSAESALTAQSHRPGGA